MPPVIGAGIVAAEPRLDAPLVSTMVGVGIPLGVLTATLWHHALAHVAVRLVAQAGACGGKRVLSRIP